MRAMPRGEEAIMTTALDADMLNTLEQAFAVQAEARLLLGGDANEAKIVEECCEVGEAVCRLARALAQRSVHYRNGGARGQVDIEAAQAFFTIMKLMVPDSDIWAHLRSETARLKRLLEQKEAGRG
jgi:hypothetical protein